jgi:diazepam-binding inhibitor (GABA receptor modulator, acyl-CoA-binding protein)
MSLDEQFADAQKRVKTLTEAPPPQTLLKLYSLFKQASVGDATGKRPGMMDFRGRAKFDAWAGLKGTSSDDAKEKYCSLVGSLVS